MGLRGQLLEKTIILILSVLVSGCSDDDIVTADQRVPKDTMGDVYKADQGTDGYDGGVPDKPKPDMGEDVGLSCKVTGNSIGGAFAGGCSTKKTTCYGKKVNIGVQKHNLVGKNGKPLTFNCYAGICGTNETLDNPQAYSVTFVAKGDSTSCGTATVTGKVK